MMVVKKKKRKKRMVLMCQKDTKANLNGLTGQIGNNLSLHINNDSNEL